MAKITLPNGCWCSDIQVYPKNWESGGPSLLKKDWYFHYRFYDPTVLNKDGKIKAKQRIIKGTNDHKTLAGRREAMQVLLKNEWSLLKDQGYNPITNTCIVPIEIEYEIDPTTPFIKALRKALEKINVSTHTSEDLTSVVKYSEIAAKQLRIDALPIHTIKRKHIKLLLEHLPKVKDKWSANTFNYYRAHLSMLFTELLDYEAVEFNPVKDIKKQKHTHLIRQVLTDKERTEVDNRLKSSNYDFWRFMQIFFHSGSREAELLRIQGKDVDLANQQFKLIIRKGQQNKEVLKTIKDIALPLWTEVMQNCKSTDYVFSIGLKPGIKAIRPEQITRRWNRHVKKPMGITADFYSLKHLNLDETAEILDIGAAANMADHTSAIITMKHYAIGEKGRQHIKLKSVNNTFVKEKPPVETGGVPKLTAHENILSAS